MPRHPSLIPYSREHHHALGLALRLKKQGPTSPNDFGWPTELFAHAARALEFLDGELEHHLNEEEQVLFANPDVDANASALILELLDEHALLRARRESIRVALSSRDEATLRPLL